jgi:hypothetical protein
MLEIASVSEFMESSLTILVRHLGLPDHKDSKTLTISPQILLFNDFETSTDKVHKLRLLFLLVKAFLQNAAVNSQLIKHESALQNANLGKFYFKMLIYNLQYMVDLHVAIAGRLEVEMAQAMDDNPYFAPDIEMPQLRRFQSLANSSLISDFGRFAREVLQNDPTETSGKEAKDGKDLSNVILWRHNPENNDKYFNRELSARSRDLGVTNKLASLGLRDFNIGNVMHIKPLSLARLNEDIDFTDYFSPKLAVEVILTYSCCLFSIATENRFICQKEFEAEQKVSEVKGGNNDSKKCLKMYKLQKNPNFIAR